MEHQSLCSAMGIPHSMQIRTLGFVATLLPNSRFRNKNDTLSASLVNGYTLDDAGGFEVGSDQSARKGPGALKPPPLSGGAPECGRRSDRRRPLMRQPRSSSSIGGSNRASRHDDVAGAFYDLRVLCG